MKDLIKESTWDNRKFGEPLPTMEDYKTAYNKKRNITEADPPSTGGEEKPPEPQKLKTDIPDTPFEPDVQQIKDKLKQTLKDISKQWETTPYMSDKHRWQEYYNDIAKLVKQLTGDESAI